MRLESTYVCEPKYTILTSDVVDLTQLFDGYEIHWSTMIGTFSIDQIINHIIDSIPHYDYVFWSQLTIFNTIINLIFTEISQLYNFDNPIPVDVLLVVVVFSGLKLLNSNVLVNYTNMAM